MYTDLSRLIRTKEKLASVLDLFTEKSISLKDYELFLTSCLAQRQAQWLGGSEQNAEITRPVLTIVVGTLKWRASTSSALPVPTVLLRGT